MKMVIFLFFTMTLFSINTQAKSPNWWHQFVEFSRDKRLDLNFSRSELRSSISNLDNRKKEAISHIEFLAELQKEFKNKTPLRNKTIKELHTFIRSYHQTFIQATEAIEDFDQVLSPYIEVTLDSEQKTKIQDLQ